jgi:hypothetical protein
MELNIDTTDRLLNAIMFCLGPYLDEDAITEHPWLFELAESYNEIVAQLPSDWRLDHHEMIRF